eukprot:scaffold3348_cov113-Isochrysis_galbana.AAC.6
MGDVDLVEWRVQDGEAAAGRYVLGAADGELVGEIMANTARLYHEEEGGKGADGLEGLADGRTQPFVDQKGEEARQQIEGEEQERYRVEEPVEERERRRSHARNDAGGVDQTADEGEREHQIAGVVVVQLRSPVGGGGTLNTMAAAWLTMHRAPNAYQERADFFPPVRGAPGRRNSQCGCSRSRATGRERAAARGGVPGAMSTFGQCPATV